jgi:hypothetical protein
MTQQLKLMYEQVAALVHNSQSVTLNTHMLPELAKAIKPYHLERQQQNHKPRKPNPKEIVFTLLVNSINYRFWHERHDFYPAQGGSSLIWKAGQASLETPSIKQGILTFRRQIASTALPMMHSRLQRIDEMARLLPKALPTILKLFTIDASLPALLEYITTTFPLTYGEDPLLKRPALALQLLHEDTGFGRNVEELPIPADYQVPKVLQAWGVLKYTKELQDKLSQSIELPQGSQPEMEIRAFTIETGRRLWEAYQIPPHVTDRFIWTQRKHYTEPFHLTTTTFY